MQKFRKLIKKYDVVSTIGIIWNIFIWIFLKYLSQLIFNYYVYFINYWDYYSQI